MENITARCNLSVEQSVTLMQIHNLMRERQSIELPKDLLSPRCSAYDAVQNIDAEIARLAPLVGDGIQKLLDNEKQGIVLLPNDVKQVQAVWQSFFILNPVTVH